MSTDPLRRTTRPIDEVPFASAGDSKSSLLLGTVVGAAVGFGIALYLCSRAGEGAICLPGYALYTLGGAVGGLVIFAIIGS